MKSLKNKIVQFAIKWAKIILLLQFSYSQSAWWLYIQSACWCYCRAGPVCTECECVPSCVTCFVMLARALWGWHDSVETCSSVIICGIIVCIFWSEYRIIKNVNYCNIISVNCITNSCIWNTCVTWHGIDYRLSEDNTIVSKHVTV